MAEGEGAGTSDGGEKSGDPKMTPVAVQEFVSKAIETAMSSLSGTILKAVDDKITGALSSSQSDKHGDKSSEESSKAADPVHGSGTLPIVNLPSGGTLTNPALWSGVKTMPRSSKPDDASTSSAMTLAEGATLNPSTPLASVVNVSSSELTNEAVIVGMNSPPVPKKLVEKIWKGDYVQLDKLLPANLGTPELTLVDLFGKNQEAG